MTQAFNLSQFANKVNTSGQASLTTAVTGTLPVANGGTGATTLTTNNVLLGNGTSALQVVAPGTNGNVLTSNGTTWTSAAAPASGITTTFTSLGTITATSGNSVSLGSLTLTSYKSLYIVVNAVRANISAVPVYISSSNIQSGGGYLQGGSNAVSGVLWLNLSNGSIGGTTATAPGDGGSAGGGKTNVSTSTTTLYFRLDASYAFNLAGGSFIIFGVQ